MIVNLKNPNAAFVERTELVTQFFSSVRKFGRLSDEEERNLFNVVKHDEDPIKVDAAKEKIAECNQRLVISIARKYAPSDYFMDAVNVGNIGLMEAINRYDPEKDAKFSTYAVYYIYREITQNVRDVYPTIRKSNISKTSHLVAKANNEFVQKEEREPTNEELMNLLNTKYGTDIKNPMDVSELRIFSIDETVSDDDENVSAISDTQKFNITYSSSNGYDTVSDNDYNKYLLTSLFTILTPREKMIIEKSFGLNGGKEEEPKDIAKEMGLTAERVRQLKNGALKRLQEEALNRYKNI